MSNRLIQGTCPINAEQFLTRLQKTFPIKINNRGDRVGYRVDENGYWLPAYVINGIDMHSDRDWWPYVWYQDINDFGEALGTYYSADYNCQHVFLAIGPWLYDTELEGAEPEFDPKNWSYPRTSALNAWGEFTAGAGGSRNGNWTYPGYVFYQPVVWQMPTSPTTTFRPIRLIPPAGVTLPDRGTYYVSDHGFVMINGTFSS